MEKIVQHFDALANHFEHYDWEYTRKDGIEHIRYTDEHNPYDKLSNRIKRAFGWGFGNTPSWLYVFEEKKSLWRRLRNRWSMFKYSLRRDSNTPDGVLAGGKIIVFWEEDGEYLQFVQPSVGALLSTFLQEDPENPHAIAIVKEMKRIQRAYDKRIKNNDVS